MRTQVVEEPLDRPPAQAVDDALQVPPGRGEVVLAAPARRGRPRLEDALFSRCRSRCTSSEREMPGIPRAMSLNRVFPRTSSRTMRGFQRSAMTSLAIATGQ